MSIFKYRIILKNIIDSSNNKVLTYLYQPILGLKAISIYQSLICEESIMHGFKKIEFNESRLLKLTGLSLENLKNYIRKLEAMGLIQTLVNLKTMSKVFNIFSPLDPVSFFKNNIFNNALQKKIGKDEYEFTRFIFRDEGDYSTESGYSDTSSKFLEVFDEFKNLKNNDDAKFLEAKPRRTNALLKGLDYSVLLDSLKKEKIIISDKNHEVKEIIEEVFGCYNISQFQIKEIIRKIYKPDIFSFSKSEFYSQVTNLLFDNNELDTMPVEFDSKQYIKNQTNKKIKEMETIDSKQYLLALLNITSLTNSQIEIIDTLQNKYKLRNSVINCLLEFSYFKNDKAIIANYLYKIAQTMIENNIKTADEAMHYLKIAHKKAFVKNKSQKNNYESQIQWQEASTKKTYEIKIEDNNSNEPLIWGKN
ncbi:DnaD domain protein [Spiroplasma taiwanense]|uniref:Chromosome replication initiation and membrane attachment protein n=1 Tax=Spiroplasma taiwanense CT-1 TaxID=1276220 RepID=S5LUR4_9MOLU|nr:DnaD domain protein [Spiroplasma taiwanense]AGR41544.1 chromosome replication initiation and membrane attachment protein [Spiroplasma taiwanense CT-1]